MVWWRIFLLLYLCGMEISSTLFVALFASLLLLVADLLVSSVLSFCTPVSFVSAFRWGMLSLILVPLAIAYGIFVGRNDYKVQEVELEFDSLPSAFDGYRIAHLSDIHSRSFQHRLKSLSRAVDIVNGAGADLIAFTGDVITIVPSELDFTSGALSRLRARDGVVSVLGNHDYCVYAVKENDPTLVREVVEKESAMGWDLLLDENRMIQRGGESIAIVGVQNTSPSRHFPSKGNLSAASSGTDGMFRIVLSHDPMHWGAEIVGSDYPLTLSGHTHAAQFSLFGWSPSRYLFREYRGLYSEGSQYLYVNAGLGETLLPLRIGAVPEITLITLRCR